MKALDHSRRRTHLTDPARIVGQQQQAIMCARVMFMVVARQRRRIQGMLTLAPESESIEEVAMLRRDRHARRHHVQRGVQVLPERSEAGRRVARLVPQSNGDHDIAGTLFGGNGDPDADRELLVLRYILGWTVRQIADHQQKSENAVSVALRRARDRAREQLTALTGGHL